MYKEMPGDSEPAWVTQEKSLFGMERDQDGKFSGSKAVDHTG